MLLNFDLNKLNNYNSESQKVRVLTENWVAKNIFCPSCGDKIFEYENNRPVADFYCNSCKEDYELKSKNTKTLGSTIADGQYNIMINKITNIWVFITSHWNIILIIFIYSIKSIKTSFV